MAGNFEETTDATPYVPPSTSGLAITALVLGILGCIPLVGVVAVVLGIIALVKIGKSDGRLTGRGLAIGGVVAGGVTTMLLIVASIFALLMFPAVTKTREAARRTMCSNNLHQIGMALSSYAGDYDEVFPPNLALLYPSYIDNAKTYSCPAHPSQYRGVERGVADRTTTSYVYVAGLHDGDSSSCVLAFERPGNHGQAGGNVMFIGARAQWMTEAELQKALAETRAEARKKGREIQLVGE